MGQHISLWYLQEAVWRCQPRGAAEVLDSGYLSSRHREVPVCPAIFLEPDALEKLPAFKRADPLPVPELFLSCMATLLFP